VSTCREAKPNWDTLVKSAKSSIGTEDRSFAEKKVYRSEVQNLRDRVREQVSIIGKTFLHSGGCQDSGTLPYSKLRGCVGEKYASIVELSKLTSSPAGLLTSQNQRSVFLKMS